MPISDILFGFGAAVLGALIGVFIARPRKIDEAADREHAEKLGVHAEAEAKRLMEEASKEATEKKKRFEMDQQEFTAQLDKMEQLFSAKSASHQKRETRLQELRQALQAEEESASRMRFDISEMQKKAIEKLMSLTGVPREKIKEQLLQQYEQNFKADAEIRLNRSLEWAEENSVRDAKNVLTEAIYRYAEATTGEHEYQDVVVPKDEIKGRIIGRGGLNIAYFEELYGVDVIFNDEPNLIIVSCFNLVQREIARFALERLMREKIITEETIAKVKQLAEQDVEKLLFKEGQAALKILGLPNMPPDFAKLVGRLKYRTSYGQNVLSHCYEVGYFARIIAGEVGADTQIAWHGGFFHDIGKAIDQEVGGSHDVLSKEILEKYGFSWEITHAAWTHHNAAPQETIEARIVQAADAISAGRPGARAESLERYLAKIKDLQETALKREGVKKAYAINAGRELRVIVESEKILDKDVTPLAQSIAAEVQEKGGYPGKIKIVTIRTTKATAK